MVNVKATKNYHALIDIDPRVIMGYEVTPANIADICLTMRRQDSRKTESILRIICYNTARIIRNRYYSNSTMYTDQMTQKLTEPDIPPQDEKSSIHAQPQKRRPPDPEFTHVGLVYPREAIRRMLSDGMLQSGNDQSVDELLNVFDGITLSSVPSLYPEGSPQIQAALAMAASCVH